MNKILLAVLLTAALSFTGRSAEKASSATRAEKTNPSATESKGAKVDLNTASAEELQALPGVGPGIASSIIAARPFKRVDELTNVTGIGPARFAEIRKSVTVHPKRHVTTSTPTASKPRSIIKESAGSSREISTPTDSTPASRPKQVIRETAPSSRENPARERSALTKKININTASKEELEALPDIGPVKAQAIIDARPFKNIEDVKRVTGIKEGIFSEIQDQITVR